MFQNIAGQELRQEEIEENDEVHHNKVKKILTKVFSKENIVIYIIAFMLSTIECLNGVAPFAIAIFAACCSNKIPSLVVYLLTVAGTLIGLGQSATLTYLLTSLVFIVMILIARPREQEEYENEKMRLGKFVFLSSFLVQAGGMLFHNFMVYDVLASIMIGISSYIFYKIFSNALIVFGGLGKKKVFAIEEVIGASIILAICASAFRGFSIFGFEIRTILSILIVLVLGWKNGVLVGATSGITIGTILGLIGQGEPMMIAAYALSGLIAGIFSRFGKGGVIVGFVLGNAIIAYVANGNTMPLIYFKEILIASLGLLLVPKSIEIDIEDLVGRTKFLPINPTNRIQENKETVYKLNNVSEAISEIADTYKEVAATIVEEEELVEEQNRKLFIRELQDSIAELENNILYEDLMVEDSEIVVDIFKILLKEQEITRKELLDVFAKHNNYIIGFDNAEISIGIELDLQEMIKAINEAYKISKVHFICQQKIEENKRNISNQLDGVSKVISSLAEDIEEQNNEEIQDTYIIEKEEIIAISKEKNILLRDLHIRREKTGRYIITTYLDACSEATQRECSIEMLERIMSKVLDEKIVMQKSQCGYRQTNSICINTFVSQDKYVLRIGIAKATKADSPVSGDSSISTKLNDGKYLLAISDGMGSGPQARQSSQIAIKMLERLLTTGFNKDTSIELINSTLSLNSEEDSYATLDIGILDLYAGNIEFIKNGACPTYIKHHKEVQIIKSLALPAGILENINLVVYDRDIEENDVMVMCSDGIMESNTEYQNKELWVKDILESIQTDNVQKIADIILKEAIDNGYGSAKDDMTIIVAKFLKK